MAAKLMYNNGAGSAPPEGGCGMTVTRLGARKWLSIVLVGLVGQFAWTIENMYFNVYLYNTISTEPDYIAAMVGWSAAAATLTALFMGALSDRLGKRRLLIGLGYILWGGSTAAFGLVTVESASKLFPAANAVAAAAVMIVVLDCVMTFFGSTANDAAFNAWLTDATDETNRGRAESVIATLPLISMLVIFGAFDGLTQAGRWREFFGIFGALVTATGVVSLFLVKDEPGLEPRRDSYFKNLVYGLRPSVARENPGLYLALAAFAVFSVAVQVFFPYLIIYIQNFLGIADYAIVLGVVLIVGLAGERALGQAHRQAGQAALHPPGVGGDVRGARRHVLCTRAVGGHPRRLRDDERLHAGDGLALRQGARPHAAGQGRAFSGHHACSSPCCCP